MAKKTRGRPKGKKETKPRGRPGTLINPVAQLTEKTKKKLTRMLGRCVYSGLEFAYKVFQDDTRVKVTRLNKFHQREIVFEDKYTPEIKAKFLEILVSKIYADRKEQVIEPPKDPSVPTVVSFDFVPVGSTGKPRTKENSNKYRTAKDKPAGPKKKTKKVKK